MNSQLLSPPSLLGQCIRGCRGKKLAEVLSGHAVDVILAQRILGSRVAAEQLGTILFDYPDMSATPVDTVVKWVESGKIPMTEAKLRAAALADETASKFFALNPWLTDPTGESVPRTKGRKPIIRESAPAIPAPAPTESAPVKKPKPVTTSSTPPPAATVPVKQPARTDRAEEPNWAEIAAEHDRHSKLPPPVKVVEKPPLPDFVGPPLPESGSKATRAENEAYTAAREIVLAEYKAKARTLGYEVDPAWPGYGDVMKHATKIETV